MAKNVIARRKLKEGGGCQGGLRRAGRGISKKKREAHTRSARRMQKRGVDIAVYHTVSPYSDRHRVCGLGTGGGGERGNT